MPFKELLRKAAGERHSCACGCCGDRDKPAAGEDQGFDFNLLFSVRLVVASLLFAAALVLTKIPEPWPPIMLAASALLAGYDIIAGAILAIINQSYFDKYVLIISAAVLAFALGQSTEGTALILLFQLGGTLADYTLERNRRSVLNTLYCDAENAHILKDGAEESAAAAQLCPGDRIVIYPGERVPCDGIVLEGTGKLDISALGGGEEPQPAGEGDEILSGCLCLDGILRCEVTAAQADSAAAAMLGSVRGSFRSGSAVPKALRRFLELYPPVMAIIAVFAAGALPIIYKIGIADSIRRAMIILVIANPCAMFAALPLIRFCGIGKSAKNGILISGMSVMEKASCTASVVFDKTGALTDGSPRVASVKSERIDADTFLKITAHALAYSDSPTARAIISSYGGTIYIELIENFSESPDRGVEVFVDSVRICAGSLEFMAEKGISVPETDISEELAVYVSIATEYAGRIMLSESLREDAVSGVAELTGQGIEVIMLSDEQAAAAAKSAETLKIKEYYSGCGREQKLETVAEIRQSLPANRTLCFACGQDAPGKAHTAADVDVSIRDIQALSNPLTADITVLNGKISGVAWAIGMAKYADKFAYITAAAVLLVKLIVFVLAFLGIATLWFGVFIDYAAAIGAILCAILVMNYDPHNGRGKLFGR